MVAAVLFDFGGVILSSPFEAFAAYERREGLPEGFIRRVNSTNPDHNAWARLERSELGIDEFVGAFEVEAKALGYDVDGRTVLGCLHGELRPEMVRVVERCAAVMSTALLTNNVLPEPATDEQTATPSPSEHDSLAALFRHFDAIVESSKVGCRKPERRFYEIALERLGIGAADAVFLDDLGINLKPARAMGMQTIKVEDPADAIVQLEAITGLELR